MAAAPASDCPICAFNEDCSINLKARGFHRASGLADNMPAYNGVVTPYGGGGAHMSSLHANVAGVNQGEPLWDKLNLGLGDKAKVQQLALQSVEGGQQLASIAIPPPAAEEPEPVAIYTCMHVCMHAYIRMYIHAHIHTHAYIHRCIPTHTHTHT